MRSCRRRQFHELPQDICVDACWTDQFLQFTDRRILYQTRFDLYLLSSASLPSALPALAPPSRRRRRRRRRRLEPVRPLLIAVEIEAIFFSYPSSPSFVPFPLFW